MPEVYRPQLKPAEYGAVGLLMIFNCVFFHTELIVCSYWYMYTYYAYSDQTRHCPCIDTANTRRSPNVGSMLANRLRRWPIIDPTFGHCLVFAGISVPIIYTEFCRAKIIAIKYT